MSASTDNTTELLEDTAVNACWRQWRTLTGPRTREDHARSIIDPEALLLLSLVVLRRERRLQDMLLWWAQVGSSLISVQRMRTLAAAFPAAVRQDLGWFASRCEASGDRRWQKTARELGGDPGKVAARPGKGPDELMLVAPATLMLQLRAGFGVGAKADLLAFLIGITRSDDATDAWASAETIAKGITYSSASVRRAAADMVRARFVEATVDRPTEYRADADSWSKTLRLRDPAQPRKTVIPPWRYWAQMFAFVAQSLEWSRTGKGSAVVQASRARDIAEAYQNPLRWNGIGKPEELPGEEYLASFQSLVADVARWVERHL